LDLAQVLAGGPGLAWQALPGGLRNVLDLPNRRKELAAVFAWAIPDDLALAMVARYSPLLECGAGTGYWAALLARRGADVLATDVSPPGRAEGRPPMSDDAPGNGANPFHGTQQPWTEVAPLDAVSAVRAHPGRVLFLCWPPFDDDSASYAALRAYQGDALLYAGDVPGPDGIRGATGTTRFHRELELNWTPAERAALPNWPGLGDRLVVYRRNAERRALAQRDRCPGCGRYLPTGAIGRCDRCFSLHPPAMAVQVNGLRVEYPAQVVVAMPQGLRRAFERSPSLLWPPAKPR
jgi:SAM-dependent methyltransferase